MFADKSKAEILAACYNFWKQKAVTSDSHWSNTSHQKNMLPERYNNHIIHQVGSIPRVSSPSMSPRSRSSVNTSAAHNNTDNSVQLLQLQMKYEQELRKTANQATVIADLQQQLSASVMKRASMYDEEEMNQLLAQKKDIIVELEAHIERQRNENDQLNKILEGLTATSMKSEEERALLETEICSLTEENRR